MPPMPMPDPAPQPAPPTNESTARVLDYAPANLADRLRLPLPLTDAIVKYRNYFWAFLIGVYAFAYNGQWRIGRDSALYRGLAHSLATGHGYTFGDFGARQVYPGLPVLLAGLERIFGLAAWPGILLMHALALTCLIFTYKLVRLRFPQWLAIIVAFCVGLNGWFLELTNELLTDIPFALGVVIALYGWERFRRALFDDVAVDASPAPRSWIKPLVYLVVGLALAALMRPTFWILAIAWVLVCAWGLLAGPHRRFYAACLGILLIVWLGVALADPRVRGFRPLQGGYELDAIHALGQVAQNLRETFPKLLQSEFAYAFFGQKWFIGLTELLSLAVILSSLLLWRVNPLWTLLVLLTVIVTLMMAVVPRYYIMVLPLLLLGWFLLIMRLALLAGRRWAEVILLAGICAVALMSFSRDVRVIAEQHNWNPDSDDDGPKWKYVLDMGEQVNKLVPAGEKVIAPAAPIMSFVSGRECVMTRDIIPMNKSPLHYPEYLAALNIHYAVFPSRLYRKSERPIRDLMDRGVIVPVARVAAQGEIVLARVEIKVPPPGTDWRKNPATMTPFTARTTAGGTTRPSAKVIAAKKRHSAAAKKALAAEKARKEAMRKRMAKLQHKKVVEAAAARARRKRHQAQKARSTAPTTQSLLMERSPPALFTPGYARGYRRAISVIPMSAGPPASPSRPSASQSAHG